MSTIDTHRGVASLGVNDPPRGAQRAGGHRNFSSSSFMKPTTYDLLLSNKRLVDILCVEHLTDSIEHMVGGMDEKVP